MKSIKVKIDVDKSSIKSITDEINKMAKNTKINIDVSGAEKSLGALVNSLSKLSEKLDGLVKGNPFKPLDDETDKTEEKMKRLQQSFEKFKETAQGKIDKLKLDGLIDTSIIDKLQQSLNSLNVNNFKDGMKDFNAELSKASKLGAEVTKNLKLENAFKDFKNKAQDAIDGLDFNDVLDKVDVKSLQKMLDNLNVDNFKENVKEVDKAIKDAVKAEEKMAQTLYKNYNANENLKQFKEQYNSILNILSKKIDSSAIDDLKNKLNSFTTDTAQSEIKQFKKEVATLAESTNGVEKVKNVFQSLAKSTLVVSAVHQGITALKNSIRDGIQYIQELDSALTDISITTGLTGGSLTNITERVQSMAVEMGTSATSVMNVAKTYANAKDSMDSVLAKSKTAIALSNISGLDTTSTTKALNTVSNAFKLMAEDGSNATEVTEHIGDVLTSISKNMQYDFGSGIQELVSGIQTAGNVAEQAGISLERYSAMVGAVIEATGRSGLNLGSLINLL